MKNNVIWIKIRGKIPNIISNQNWIILLWNFIKQCMKIHFIIVYFIFFFSKKGIHAIITLKPENDNNTDLIDSFDLHCPAEISKRKLLACEKEIAELKLCGLTFHMQLIWSDASFDFEANAKTTAEFEAKWQTCTLK